MLRNKIVAIKEWWRKAKEHDDLFMRYLEERKRVSSAEKVVAGILGRGIAWYDYKELDDGKRNEYYQTAVGILQSEVFKNELNAAMSDLVQEIAKESRDFNHVMNLRMTINGMQLLQERLESIAPPPKKQAVEDPYNPL